MLGQRAHQRVRRIETPALAGKAYLAYRRKGGTKRSPLPDFYIGAHAAVAGYRLSYARVVPVEIIGARSSAIDVGREAAEAVVTSSANTRISESNPR